MRFEPPSWTPLCEDFLHAKGGPNWGFKPHKIEVAQTPIRTSRPHDSTCHDVARRILETRGPDGGLRDFDLVRFEPQFGPPLHEEHLHTMGPELEVQTSYIEVSRTFPGPPDPHDSTCHVMARRIVGTRGPGEAWETLILCGLDLHVWSARAHLSVYLRSRGMGVR